MPHTEARDHVRAKKTKLTSYGTVCYETRVTTPLHSADMDSYLFNFRQSLPKEMYRHFGRKMTLTKQAGKCFLLRY